MDPNLIHVDWERTGEALTLVIVLAFLIERALAVIFENPLYIRFIDRDGLKELIAVVASIAVCAAWQFDALGMILLTSTTTVAGYIVTGLVVAGGSKASIKLFHGVLGIQSTASLMRHQIRAERAATQAEAVSSEAIAAAEAGAARKAGLASARSRRLADDARRQAERDGTTLAMRTAASAEAAATRAQDAAVAAAEAEPAP